MKNYGLVGKNISYSFSESFFKNFFEINKIINSNYKIYDLENINDIRFFIKENNLLGLNITIPYKEEILNYVDEVSIEVSEIGACNTLLIKNNSIKAYNTDVFGFEECYLNFLEKSKKGLIIGTGGVSKSVSWILKKYNIQHDFLSRKKKGENIVSYDFLKKNGLESYDIIINCSPLGTFPNIYQKPDIDYNTLKKNVFLVDLIYNPQETLFMKLGKLNGGIAINGLRMLEIQAKKSWGIWNNKNII